MLEGIQRERVWDSFGEWIIKVFKEDKFMGYLVFVFFYNDVVYNGYSFMFLLKVYGYIFIC